MITATLSQLDVAPGFQLSKEFSLRVAFAGLHVVGPRGAIDLPVPAAVAGALSALDSGQVLSETTAVRDEALWPVLQQLARLGALERVVRGPDGLLLEVQAAGEHYCLRAASRPPSETKICLSPFSYLRRESSDTVLESPLCHSRARLVPELAVVLASLSRAQMISVLLERNSRAVRNALEAAIALLLAEGFIALATETGEAASEDSVPLRQWEFHDLLFHSRTRFGRHRNPVGGTYRFRGVIQPLPAVKPRMSDIAIPLVRPDLDTVSARDLSITDAVERRTSVRRYGDSPITLVEMGEFLYRTARVRRIMRIDGVELSSRPYPNGGASYELELYLLADRCAGLLPGLFHYDPVAHQLEPLLRANDATEQFLADAFAFCGRSTRPEVLILISARFQRVSWKYAAIAYATILKNVGALYQTMYLVATSMGLGPCALGSGDSDRFSELVGEDYYTERWWGNSC